MTPTDKARDITRRPEGAITDMDKDERRIWIKAIVERMMQAWGFKNKKQLADELSLNAKGPSSWIQNGSIPWSAIFICSNKTGKSLDWLYYGGEPEVVLAATTKTLLQERVKAFLEMSQKTKQISEVNDNGIATLADGLSDDIEAFYKEFGQIVHILDEQWWRKK